MKKFEANTIAPAAPLPTILEVSKLKSFRVAISSVNDALQGLLSLIYKFYIQRDRLTEVDLVFLTEARLYIQKYENNVGLLTQMRWMKTKQLVRIMLTFDSVAELPRWAEAQRRILFREYYSPRTFLSIKKKPEDFIKVRNRAHETKLHLKRYIGVGYRDKGTASIPSENGSPSWQTVAQRIDTGSPNDPEPIPKVPIGVISPLRI